MDAATEFDPNDLTLDEIEAFEDITDMPLDEALDKGTRKAKVMKALAFILLRREDPNITLEDVGKMKLSAVPFGGGDPS